jgi:bifunctional non-homologous end joining protein LigD
MSARIERGRVQLLTRTGLNWSEKYPVIVAALAKLPVAAAYLDGELCGIGEDGLPSFAQTQAASDGSQGVRLVYYAFDLLHLDGRDIAGLPLIERKAILEPRIAGVPGVQFNGHVTDDGERVLKHACDLRFEGIVSKTIDAPYTPGNRGLWRKSKCLNRQEFSAMPTRPAGPTARGPLRTSGGPAEDSFLNPTASAARSSLAQHQRIAALGRTADRHDGNLLHRRCIDHGH